jgi:hypothetical protein
LRFVRTNGKYLLRDKGILMNKYLVFYVSRLFTPIT